MNDGGKADIGDNFVNVSGDLPQRTASVSTICVRVVCFSGHWGGVLVECQHHAATPSF